MKIHPVLLNWLPYAIVIVGLAGLNYASNQQDLRHNANDPQVQLAEDGAAKLATGVTPGSVVGTEMVNVATSLAPFTVVFDASGKPIASSGQLDGSTPFPPAGTLDFAKAHGMDSFSWEPTNGLRFASVLRYYQQGSRSGYILTARSLREVESRVDQLTQMTALATLVLLLSTLVIVAGTSKFRS